MNTNTHHCRIALVAALTLTVAATAAHAAGTNAEHLAIAPGPFQPTWDSLESQYQTPEWFRDAKFGIWAHWGAQCQPEQGDWYARNMYMQGSPDYKYQVATYGHPSTNGFKDVINAWKADQFDPERLIALYKKAGAKYFVMMANHHCNFDNFDSTYQPWNSTKIGPKKDLVGMWEKATRKEGLRFGVTVHAGRAWSWYEVAQGADTNGPMKGIPYDGKLTKADGKGLWWDGLDPQALYAQDHAKGATPDAAYCDKFFLRTKELMDKYRPDLVYFDDSVLPLKGASEAYGLRLAAHYYNSSAKQHGQNEAVMNTKRLDERQRKALVWDIERGKSDRIEPLPWQTDTCIGSWHYKRSIFDKHGYKTAAQVVPMLVDIVSKNGNLLLSIPVRGNGAIDADEEQFLSDMAAWIAVNGEGIYGTRPWKTFGEGPSVAIKEANRFGGVKDTQSQPFTPEDIRFTQKGETVFAFVHAWPADGKVLIKSIGTDAKLYAGEVGKVELLGSKSPVKWQRSAAGLAVELPPQKPCAHAYTIKITSR